IGVFLGHPQEIATVPFPVVRIEPKEHTLVGLADGGVEEHDRYDISLAPASRPAGAKDHYEFSYTAVSHSAPDLLDQLRRFVADREQRSIALVLKRAEPFQLGAFGCVEGFAVFMVLIGVVLLRAALGVLLGGRPESAGPPMPAGPARLRRVMVTRPV